MVWCSMKPFRWIKRLQVKAYKRSSFHTKAEEHHEVVTWRATEVRKQGNKDWIISLKERWAWLLAHRIDWKQRDEKTAIGSKESI